MWLKFKLMMNKILTYNLYGGVLKSHWITHKGKKIIYCDYSHFEMDHEAIAKEIEETDALICGEPEQSVLSYLDIRGTVGTPEIVSLFRQSATRTKKHVLKNAAGPREKRKSWHRKNQ